MPRHISQALGWLALSFCLLAIAAGLVALGSMLLASVAFADGIRIQIPFVATFDGVRSESGSPSVTITGSPAIVGVVAGAAVVTLGAVAFRNCSDAAKAPGRGSRANERASTARRRRSR